MKESPLSLFLLCGAGSFAIMLADVFLGLFVYEALIFRLGMDGDISLLMTALMYLFQGLVLGLIVARILKKKAEKKKSSTLLSKEYTLAKNIFAAIINGYKKK
jgi:hypothetical protein